MKYPAALAALKQRGVHPAADTFPIWDEQRMTLFADSLRCNGLRNVIWVAEDGSILDGRQRFVGCLMAGVEPRLEQYTGDDPENFVADMNLERRHQEEGSRGLSARRLGRLAAQRNRKQRDQPQLPGVSDATETMLDTIEELGCKELQDAVASGALPVDLAAALAQRDEDQQRQAIAEAAKPVQDEPKRAQVDKARVISKAIEVSAVEIVGLRTLYLANVNSNTAEKALGAKALARLVPEVVR
jgi:hypothetical protein